MQSFSRRDYLAAAAVVLIWGLNFVAMKFALRDFTPFQLGAARYVFAALPLALWLRPPHLPARWVLLYGLFQGVGQFGFLFCALKVGMTAALASVLMQTQVLFTAVLGFVLLRERASRALIWGLGLACLGLSCFVVHVMQTSTAGSGASTVTGWGLLLNICAAAMWAASNIVARKAQQSGRQFDALAFVVWSSLVPIVPFVLMALLWDDPATRSQWHSAPLSSWLAVAYLGWIATAVAYGLWTGLLRHHAANRVAPLSLGVPLVGLSAGMWVLGERLSTWQWGGMALILAALAVVLGSGLRRA